MKRKTQLILTLLTAIGWSTLSCGGDDGIQPEPLVEGDLVLYSQDAVDEAGRKGHIDISGSLIITDSVNSRESPITDLSALSTIQTISGDLVIMKTGRLSTLDGLNGLAEIGGNISIEENQNLLELDALSGVTRFSDPEVSIANNFILQDLEGLNGVTVANSVYLHSNRNLSSLVGLENLRRVTGFFTIGGNERLGDLNALSGLEHTGELGIYGGNFRDFSGLSGLKSTGALHLGSQNQITDLTGFAALIDIGVLSVIRNTNLSSLRGLTNVQTTVNKIEIQANDALTDLRGLEFITRCDEISILQNKSLMTLAGLDNLEETSAMIVFNNQSLNDLTALSRLEKVNQSLSILGNARLSTLDGLEGLKSAVFIDISRNENLANLNAFQSLETLRDLQISENPRLISLDAFQSLDKLDGFWADKNSSLSDFCGIANVDIRFDYQVNENAFNPTAEDLANGRCKD